MFEFRLGLLEDLICLILRYFQRFSCGPSHYAFVFTCFAKKATIPHCQVSYQVYNVVDLGRLVFLRGNIEVIFRNRCTERIKYSPSGPEKTGSDVHSRATGTNKIMWQLHSCSFSLVQRIGRDQLSSAVPQKRDNDTDNVLRFRVAVNPINYQNTCGD